MDYRAFFVGIILTLLFLLIGLFDLAFVIFAVSFIVLIYNYMESKAKKAWDQVKKADASSPEAKLEAYTKNASKQAAEFLIPAEGTEYNYKGAIHKTPQLAKNFFAELKDLFK